MFKRTLILLFVIFFVTKNQAQFLDKNFYLVDSIEKKESNKNDFILIDKNLKLFHAATVDTIRLKLLNEIVENCNDETI